MKGNKVLSINNLINESSITTNLDETVNSDLAETEIDFNENNKRNNNKNFVRLNSNSIDPAKNKYLENDNLCNLIASGQEAIVVIIFILSIIIYLLKLSSNNFQIHYFHNCLQLIQVLSKK